MRGKLLSVALVVLMFLGCFGVVGTRIQENNNVDIREYVPGEVIVGFCTGLEKGDLGYIDVREINSFKGYVVKEKIEALNAAVVKVDEGQEMDFIDSIVGSPFVKYAEYNRIVHILSTPNDPLWEQQWGPMRIHCEKAWDTDIGDSDVVIAIVDTGVDYTHEDLAGNYISGGYDWVNDDSDPMDDNNHGTHCAGIAAAVMNNNKGIAGVAQVSIMAEKVLDSGGSGSSSDVADGILHAADNGADIISMSLGSSDSSSVIEDACNYAYNSKDVILVAAAGNDGSPSISYPARYDTVIAVGAIDTTDERCDFSNYGDDLELVAPGYRIVSTIPGDNYDFYSGTSMACPHVAGVASLAISRYPGKNNVWIRQKLIDSAEDLGSEGWDRNYGYGLVDARLEGGGPSPWPKVILEIHKIEGIDPIEVILGGDPEWYYEVGVGSGSYFEYNGHEQVIIPGWWWIFVWNSQNIWMPDKDYSFDAENPETTVKIKLMEHDGILEGGKDDLADISSYSGGGADNSIEDVRGAIYNGAYNLITNELTGDFIRQDGAYYVTSGEDDGSTSVDENDAKIWFKITDNYEKSEPDLDAQGELIWNKVKPGSTNTGIIYVKNIGEIDIYGQNNLNWRITEYPSWGTWTFTPSSGTNLKPEDGPVNVQVSVIAPNQRGKIFEGKIKIENTDNPDDYAYIDIILRTPKNKLLVNPLFAKVLERFPILGQLFSFFINGNNWHGYSFR